MLDPLPGLSTLLTTELRTGNAIVGRVEAKAGELWIDVNCLGEQDLVVKFEPMDSFTLPCTAAASSPSRNRINLLNPRELKISVTAPESAKWSLRVQQ